MARADLNRPAATVARLPPLARTQRHLRLARSTCPGKEVGAPRPLKEPSLSSPREGEAARLSLCPFAAAISPRRDTSAKTPCRLVSRVEDEAAGLLAVPVAGPPAASPGGRRPAGGHQETSPGAQAEATRSVRHPGELVRSQEAEAQRPETRARDRVAHQEAQTAHQDPEADTHVRGAREPGPEHREPPELPE